MSDSDKPGDPNGARGSEQPPAAATRSAESRPSDEERASTTEASRSAVLPTELDIRRPPRIRVGSAPVLEIVSLKKATLAPPSRIDALDAEPLPDSAGPSYVGFTVDDRYEIESIIAEGGMGVVYRARHRVIDRTVAVKVLRPDFAKDRELTERFLTEAKAASAIGHASIVDVFDFGELPDGATYLAMEYVEGKPLSKLIKEGPVPVERVLAIGRRIAAGLAAAHEAGIVHRDLKPDNLVLTARDGEEDFVKILDFGIAKVAGSQNRLTRAGTIFGTPQYMSPEQGAGGEVDHRSDLYSLGIILYEMTSGRLPFEAENPIGMVTQHMYEKAPLISEMDPPPQAVPAGLEAIILKCISKKPDHRYGSMAELIDEIDKVRRGELPDAVEELAARSSDFDVGRERFTRAIAEEGATRHRRTWPLVAALVLVAAGAVALLGRRSTDAVSAGKEPAADDGGVAGGSDQGNPPSETPRTRSVAVVVSPIDAHVFRGRTDLGEMPVFIDVEAGRKVRIRVQRDGFHSKQVLVDGTRRKVVVKLKPIPGVEPAVPVPDAGKLQFDLKDLLEEAPAEAGPGPAAVTPDGSAPSVSPPGPSATAAPAPRPGSSGSEMPSAEPGSGPPRPPSPRSAPSSDEPGGRHPGGLPAATESN